MEENVLNCVPNHLAFENGSQVCLNFFEDKYVFYRFCFDCDTQCEDNLTNDQQTIENNNNNFQINETNSISIERAESEILHCLQLLNKLSSAAMFRKVLQKAPDQSKSAFLSFRLFFCKYHITFFNRLPFFVVFE